jgi:hypothetical protein
LVIKQLPAWSAMGMGCSSTLLNVIFTPVEEKTVCRSEAIDDFFKEQHGW